MSSYAKKLAGLALAAWIFALASCAHQPASKSARGLLRLEVEPADAAVFVDDEYMGQVDGWVQQTIPLHAGIRMVEIRAPGYMSQRFDVDVRSNEEVTLSLQMEPEIVADMPERTEEPL